MEAIILGHGKAQSVFDQHLPLWKAHGLPITVFTPIDDPLDSHGFRRVRHGKSSRMGPKAVERLLEVMRYVSLSEHSASVIFEYDSFCLDKVLTEKRGLHGIVHVNTDIANRMAPRYVLVPWMLDRDSAKKMVSVAEDYPDIHEDGVSDRLISAWAFVAGVPILSHSEPTYAENTIFPPYESKQGFVNARWIHGVKDPECLAFILSLWKS